MNTKPVHAVVKETPRSIEVCTWAWSEDNARYAMRNLITAFGGTYEVITTHFHEVKDIKHYNQG